MKILTLFLLLNATFSHAATHYFVRHAEKKQSHTIEKNPPLTLKGLQRAQNLALLLSQADIKQIHSTAYKRTQMTAKPLADLLRIPINHYDPRVIENLIERLKKSDENTLVVGHSNTTTEAVSLLTKKALNGLSEDDYGDVFQVIIEGEHVTVNHLMVAPASQKSQLPQDTNTK